MAKEVVRVQTLDGTWETLGVDYKAGVVPEGLQLSADSWGPSEASFSMKRNEQLVNIDLLPWTPTEIEVDGRLAWEGRTVMTPSGSAGLGVNLEGWQAHLDDDTISKRYAFNSLTDWKDCRSTLNEDLTVHNGSVSNVEVGAAAIVLNFVNPSVINGATRRVGVVADMGPKNFAKRLIIDYEHSGGEGNVVFKIQTADGPNSWGLSSDDYNLSPSTALNSATTGTIVYQSPTKRRYVHLFLESVWGGTLVTNHWFRINRILIVPDVAWEASNYSNLKASDIVKDARDNGTLLLSRDNSYISNTTFNIPVFNIEEATTRETLEQANAFHRYRLGLKPERKLAFRPQPTRATLQAAVGTGVVFEDATANSGADTYNHVIVKARDAADQPIRVERYASQLSAALPFRTVASQTIANPSAEVNVANWTPSNLTLTRDTAPTPGVHSGTASFKLAEATPGALHIMVSDALGGTFKAGTTYLLEFAAASNIAVNSRYPLKIEFGNFTTGDIVSGLHFPQTAWQTPSVAWTPQTDWAGVQIKITGYVSGAQYMWVDSFSLFSIVATLPDRRGFKRTKILDVGSTIDATTATTIGDLFLALHMTTPLKGTLTIAGKGSVQAVAEETSPGSYARTTTALHPVDLMWRTGEIIRLTNLIDPDTGGQGRNGIIAGVRYENGSATVTIDNERDNFQTIMSRLAVISGA